MNRRDLITPLGGTAMLPVAARAQQPTTPMVADRPRCAPPGAMPRFLLAGAARRTRRPIVSAPGRNNAAGAPFRPPHACERLFT